MANRPSISWPPNEWDEGDFHRDKDSRLPTRLHPFEIQRDRDSGLWTISFWSGKGDKETVLQEGIDGIFAAFRLMLDKYEEWYPTRPHSRVYFIGTELKRGALIKVGVSRYPERRLAQLQTGHGEKLSIFLTVPGTEDDEAKYHRRWSSRRRHGEWFTIGDCILDEIKRLSS